MLSDYECDLGNMVLHQRDEAMSQGQSHVDKRKQQLHDMEFARRQQLLQDWCSTHWSCGHRDGRMLQRDDEYVRQDKHRIKLFWVIEVNSKKINR